MTTQPTHSRLNKKALIQNTVKGLNLKTIVRPVSTTVGTISVEDRVQGRPGPDEMAVKATGTAAIETPKTEASQPLTAPRSLNTEETVSEPDPVKNEPGHDLILSGEENDPVKSRPSQEMTESESDPVNTQPGQILTGSKNDTITAVNNSTSNEGAATECAEPKESKRKLPRYPQYLTQGVLKPRDCYIAVPNFLLREDSPFETPNDFMVYLRLFGVSFGFGRNTCDMGLSELGAFTHLCKNSVKKSIERLERDGWIRKIGDFEPGQVTRKWRVLSPWEKGLTPDPTYHPKDGPLDSLQPSDFAQVAFGTKASVPIAKRSNTGSNSDSVTNRLGQSLLQRGSENDPVTGSKNDPYSNKYSDNYKNNSLSQFPEVLQSYFAELRPARKRESEWQAFEELKRDYPILEIAAAFTQVRGNGIPGGEACHSPMAYLASAINDVLATLSADRERERKRADTAATLEAAKQRTAEAEAREQEEWDRRERAFNHAFPEDGHQDEIIAELCLQNGFYTTKGIAASTFAVGAWFKSLNSYEKLEAVG